MMNMGTEALEGDKPIPMDKRLEMMDMQMNMMRQMMEQMIENKLEDVQKPNHQH